MDITEIKKMAKHARRKSKALRKMFNNAEDKAEWFNEVIRLAKIAKLQFERFYRILNRIFSARKLNIHKLESRASAHWATVAS